MCLGPAPRVRCALCFVFSLAVVVLRLTEGFQLLINNEWRNSVSGKTFDAISPADESVIATVQEADKEDVGMPAWGVAVR